MENEKWAETQLTEQQAIAMAKSGEYNNWTDDQIVRFQLFQHRLCMDFSKFHEALTNVLQRPVFTHELMSSNRDNIVMEYLGERDTPTLEEIINLIPEEKRIILEI